MDLKEIKQIISLMTRSDLSEFSIEEDGLKLRIRRGTSNTSPLMPPPQVQMIPAPAPSAAAPSPAPAGAPTGAVESEPGVTYVKSPMVGTFYRAASPEGPPFVDTGARIVENSPVCIIEAMKIMNEIQAEVKGVIMEVLVENGQPVEFGQRLFKVQVT